MSQELQGAHLRRTVSDKFCHTAQRDYLRLLLHKPNKT
jgi:hypothetical protein